MRIPGRLQQTILFIIFILLRLSATGQIVVHGTIYERSATVGLAGVSVRSNSGAGTATDSLGRYMIRLPLTDSIWFTYQGKPTMKFAVTEIPRHRAFDMKLHVDIQVLPMVEVIKRSYRLDSIAHREEYRKVFDFEREYITSGSAPGSGTIGAGVGINLDLLFNWRKAKRMEHFRTQLVQIERDKYVDYRFNRSLIKRLTGLDSTALDNFMIQYRPSYEMLLSFETEYEYYQYIREWGRAFTERWKKEN